jgi:hypothetical protein
MPLDFPNSPSNGQIYSSGSSAWLFDGTKWTPSGTGFLAFIGDTPPTPPPTPGLLWWNSSPGIGQLYVYYNDGTSSQWVAANNMGGGLYLPLTGGTLTGPLVLAADPTSALQAATKQYADAATGAPNKLINPFMEIDQANEGALLTSSGGTPFYVVDGCWLVNSGGTVTGQRSTDAPPGYPNSVILTQTVTGAVVAGSYCLFGLKIEADELADTGFGTSNARTLSVAFWAKASIAGTYAATLQNSPANTRSFPFNFTLAANTWQLITQVIPGDTAGTWVIKGNAQGAELRIIAVAGSTYQGTAGVWQAGNFLAGTGISNTMATTLNATFQLGPCGLWVAPAPQPLLRTSFQSELARCQRYYEKSYDLGTAVGAANANTGTSNIAVAFLGATGFVGTNAYYKQTKRASPTVTLYSPITGAAGKVRDFSNTVDLTPTLATGQSALNWSASPAGTNYNVGTHWTADARL